MVRSDFAVGPQLNHKDGLDFLGEYGLPVSRVKVTIKAVEESTPPPKPAATPEAPEQSEEASNEAAASLPAQPLAGAAAPATASTKPKSPAATASAGTPKKQAPAGATQPAAATQSSGPAPASTPKAEPTSFCAGVRKSYNDDRAAIRSAAQAYADFSTDVVTSAITTASQAKGSRLSKADGEKFLKRLRTLAADVDLVIAKDTRAKNLLTIVKEHCPQPIAVELSEVVEVSDQQTFRLYTTPQWSSDDTLTVDSEGGYVKLIDATADDKTLGIVEAATNSIGTIYSLFTPTSVAYRTSALPVDRLRAKIAQVLKAGASGITETLLNQLKSELDQASGKIALATPRSIDIELPVTRTLNLPDLEKEVTAVLDGDHLVFSTDARPANGAATPASADATNAADLEIALKADCGNAGAKRQAPTPPVDGLIVSGLRSCAVVATREGRELGRVQFAAADDRAWSYLPVPRRSMVKQTTKYSFASGRLTKAEIGRPSALAAGVSIPKKLIGGFIGGFTEGLTSQKSKAEAQKELATAQKERITAEDELRKLKRQIKKDAEDEAKKDQPSPPPADGS
jgi:hypothetical protein